MKNRYNFINKFKTAVLLLIVLTGSHLYAEGPVLQNGEKYQVNLIDTDKSFTILYDYSKPDYFSRLNINLNYFKGSFPDSLYKGSINVYSMKKTGNKNDLSAFSLYTALNPGMTMKINWEIPTDDKNEELRGVALEMLLKFSSENQGKHFSEMFTDNNIWYRSSYPFTVNYADNPDSEYPESIGFTIETGNSPGPRYLRTFAEIFSISAIGYGKYWYYLSDNKEDWVYPPTWSGVKRKLGDPWSFDKNSFQTNTIDHIYAGAIYYQAARSNGFGIIGSSAWSFMGSMIWEYFAEFREAVSANDVIFTPTGAFIGEAFRQLSIYVERNFGRNILGKIGMFILDPVRVINRQLDIYSTDSFRVSLTFLNPAQAILDQSQLLKKAD